MPTTNEGRKQEDHRWFAPADRGVPQARFSDVTIEIDLGEEVSVEEEELPPILPTPAQRMNTPLPAGAHQDVRFSELNAIVGALRAVLRDNQDMLDAEIDSVEWQLRERIAKL